MSRSCASVARAVGDVRRGDLRPDDGPEIRPALIGTDGAPAVPQPEAITEASDAGA